MCAFAGSRLSVDRIRDQLSFTAVHEAAAPRPAAPRPAPPRRAPPRPAPPHPTPPRLLPLDEQLTAEAAAAPVLLRAGGRARVGGFGRCGGDRWWLQWSPCTRRWMCLERIPPDATRTTAAACRTSTACHRGTLCSTECGTGAAHGDNRATAVIHGLRQWCAMSPRRLRSGLKRAKVSVGRAPQPNAQGSGRVPLRWQRGRLQQCKQPTT